MRAWFDSKGGIFESRGQFTDVDGGGLKVFVLNVDKVVQWGVFVRVGDDKFQIAKWLLKCGEFGLKLSHLANSCHCFVEVGNLRQSVHVLFDFADDLGIVCSLQLEPVPDCEEFLARGVLVVVEDICTFVQDPC